MISSDFLRIVKQQNKHKPYLGSYQPSQNMMKYGKSLGMVYGSQGFLTLLSYMTFIFSDSNDPEEFDKVRTVFGYGSLIFRPGFPFKRTGRMGPRALGLQRDFQKAGWVIATGLSFCNVMHFQVICFVGISWPSSNELLHVSLGFFGILWSHWSHNSQILWWQWRKHGWIAIVPEPCTVTTYAHTVHSLHLTIYFSLLTGYAVNNKHA